MISIDDDMTLRKWYLSHTGQAGPTIEFPSSGGAHRLELMSESRDNPLSAA